MEVNVSPAREAAPSVGVELPPRVAGRAGDEADGPVLIVFGAVHGNEPAGYVAMTEVFRTLERAQAKLRGSVIGLVGNRQALAEGMRFMEQDLNRLWLPEPLALIGSGGELSGELVEAGALKREIDLVLKRAAGRVSALDIHSTSGPGPPFVVFDDSIVNREFALEMEVPMVLGLEEELEGTLMDFMNDLGVRTVGFEAGQHDEEVSVTRAAAAIWVALRASGVLGRSFQAEVDRASRLLAAAAPGLPTLFEVRHRHAIAPRSSFRMNPGLAGFQTISQGEQVALEDGMPVKTPSAGRLLMPLYQPQGEDGYFIIRPVRTVWLSVSAYLRRLRLERFVHWLPGVARLDAGGREIKVNRRIARWLPLDFFHLLGFRRIAEMGRHLFLRRRSPEA